MLRQLQNDGQKPGPAQADHGFLFVQGSSQTQKLCHKFVKVC
jgi:hypothetical protein